MIVAAYKGDEFIIVDEVERVAERLNVAIETVKLYTTPSYKRRLKNSDNCIWCFKLEEDE